MTLLVATLIYPTATTFTNPEENIFRLLPLLIPELIFYAIAFFILATYWILHHLQYYFVKKPDMTSVRLIMLAMFFVALMPVSTAIAVLNSNPTAEVFLEANIGAIGICYLLHWAYAIRNGRLLEKPLPGMVWCISLRRGLVTPVLSLAAIGIALAGIPFSIILYLTIPVFEWIAERSCGRSH